MQQSHKTARFRQKRDLQPNRQIRKKAEESDALARGYDPLRNTTCRIGDSACAAKHVSIIRRTGLFHSVNESQKVGSLLRLQQQYGNRFVRGIIAQNIQAKLKTGQPGDICEQEAGRVAEQVMQMPEPQPQRQSEEESARIQPKPLTEQITPLVQRQLEEEEGELQAKKSLGQSSEGTPSMETHINAMRSGGQRLPETVRAYFEPRFGHDFSQIRVHTDSVAAESAQLLNARAYTTGQNIIFGAGQYAPGTTAGKKVLAHELVHTLQQSSYGRIRPKSIQRAGEEKPSPVVIVSGPKKIPELKEDAAEKIIRTTGAKQEKAGNYRFVPVSGYADFVAKAHNRLEANECASTVLIDGHGGSDADSAWMVMGSVTDPNRGWGTTDIGNNNGTLVGADVLKNIKFCSPCQVYLGGCNFAATKHGMKFMQTVANSSGCTVKAYATKTVTNPKTGFPEPSSDEDEKKPGKP